MSDKDQAAPGFEQRAKEEFTEFLGITIYLACFFSSITTYSMLLLRQHGGSSASYAFGLINALVIAKVIVVGRMAHLGSGLEAKPLYQAVFTKAFLFSLLVLIFHFLEEFIRRLAHHEPSGTVIRNINPDQLIGRMLLVFCSFVPLFAFLELRRVIGAEELHALFLKRGSASAASQKRPT